MFDKALLSLPGMKRILVLLAALALGQAISVVGQAFTLATAITHLWEGADLASQTTLVAAFLGFFLLKQLVAFGQDALLCRYAREQTQRLRERLLRKAFAGPVGWVRAQGTASVATCALEGVDQVETYIRVILPKLVNLAAVLPVTLIAVFALDWVSGIILLMVVPVIVFYMVLLGRAARDRAARQYGSYQRLSNHFMDTLRGLDTVKAFGAGRREARGVFRTSEDFRHATMRTLRMATLSGAVLDLFATLGVAAVAMMLGFRLVVGQMALFPALAALIIAPEYFLPLRQFAGDFHASLDGRNALADILRRTDSDEQQAADAETFPLAPWNEHSTLSLHDVRFSYPAEDDKATRPVLEHVELSVTGFQKVGIIGPSGSGKSTLASILGGFLEPGGGQIRVDGSPLPHLSLPAWQRQVLYIPQDPYLFHATLRENLVFYHPSASDAQVLAAVQAVGLDRLVDELPQGLDTLIGEGERGLSGGQAHRIALARALLDPDRRILIFDEPTAHLDLETELELKERMLPLMENRLVLFATHRTHWLGEMDRIFRIADGHLEEVDEARTGGSGGGMFKNYMVAGAPASERPSSLETRHWRVSRALGSCSNSPRLVEMSTGHFESLRNCAWDPSPGTPGCHSRSPKPFSNESDTSGPHERPEEKQPRTTRGERSARGEISSGDFAEQRSVPPGTRTGSPRWSLKHDTWVRPYFTTYRKNLVQALGLGIAAAGFAALLMFTSGYLIAATGEAAGSILYYYLPIAFVQLFGLGKPILHYLERLASHDWVFRMTSSLRVRLFKALEFQALKPDANRRSGDVLGMVAEDIGHIQNLYLRVVFPLAIAWLLLAITLVVFACLTPLFALALFVLMGAAGIALPLACARILDEPIRIHKHLKNGLYQGLTDDLLGISDWIFSGRGEQGLLRNLERAAREQEAAAGIDRVKRWMDLAVALLLGLGVCLVLSWSALRFGTFPGATGGTANWIAAFTLGFFPLIEAFMPLPASALQAGTHRDSIERLNRYPQTDDHVDVPEPSVPATNGEDLVIEGLCFAYETSTGNGKGNGLSVLRGIDLQIPAGQHLAILGRSGSGKSTLASLLRGDLRPSAGTVRLGDVPTCELGDGIAAHIGIVQQDAYLFDRTLKDNLRIGAPEASDEELWDVLRQVRLEQMVRALPDGLGTMADEAGMRFSGGERHRVALARVLLANTPVILLDEPTVGLDAATERSVLETLMEASRGKTLVMITHHLQGIEAFDRVVFLEDGLIELDGSPATLAATSERYRRLLACDA